MQNSKHISDLKKQHRQFETVPFYSIVVFYGNCVLKDINFVPNGTFLVKSNRVLELMETLMKNNELSRYTNKNEIVIENSSLPSGVYFIKIETEKGTAIKNQKENPSRVSRK